MRSCITLLMHNMESLLMSRFRVQGCSSERAVRGTYPAVVGEKDGVALDVSVDHSLGVQNGQSLQDRQTHRSDLLLVHPGGTDVEGT